jgi:hypothetical protein
MNQIGRTKLEKIAGESPELQAIYLKKFEEIEKRILIGDVTWDQLEDLIYEALTSSEEVQEIAMNFLKRRVEERRKNPDKKPLILKEDRTGFVHPDYLGNREN